MKIRQDKSRSLCRLLMAALAWFCPAVLSAQINTEQLALHQQRAREAQERQDFSTAVKEYKVLNQLVPNNAELVSNLGVAFYFQHDLQQAATTFRHSLSLNPGLYVPRLFLGLTLAHLSQPDAAIEQLQKAAAINGSDPTVHTWLGYEYTAQEKFEKAAEQFEIAAQKTPDDLDVWFALGHCYTELGKIVTTQLIQTSPDSGRVWQLAAEQYESRGNSSKAFNLYAKALQRRPDINELQTKVAALGGTSQTIESGSDTSVAQSNTHQEDVLYAQVKEYEQKARSAFEQIARIDPDSYRAHEVLGDAAMAAELYDDAIHEYDAVLQRKPDLPGIHRMLCVAYSYVSKVEDAIRECQAEIALSPYSADSYVEAARVYMLSDQGDHYDRASAFLTKAITLDRPPIAAYKLLGKMYLRHEKYAASIAALNKYVAAEPNDVTAYYLLARAYKNNGDPGNANKTIAIYRSMSDKAKSRTDAQRVLTASQPVSDDDKPQE